MTDPKAVIELLGKVNAARDKKHAALQAIVTPARAAANAMTDAGLVSSAGPLKEALFQFDAAHQELMDLSKEKHAAEVAHILLLEMMKGSR